MVPAMKAAPLIATAVVALAGAGCAPARTTMARYPGSAPQWDRTKQDPKAAELADKVVAAAGGMDKWNAVKQIKWTEKVMNDGKAVLESEEVWDRWNARHWAKLMHTDSHLIVVRELYGEQQNAYSESGQQAGPRQKMAPAEAAKIVPLAVDRFQFDTAALAMPFLLEEPGTTLAYVGQAQGDDGKPLEVIKVTFDASDKARSGSSYQVDVDPATNTIARLEIVKPGGNVGYKLSSYKDVNGMKFPMQMNNIGYAGEVITFDGLDIGDPTDSLFVEQIH